MTYEFKLFTNLIMINLNVFNKNTIIYKYIFCY